MGGFLAAVGSSKEALALYERKFKRLICVQRVKCDEIKRGKGNLCIYPVFTWKSSGSCATLSSDETDKEGDLESRVLPVTVDETLVAPSVETAWRREEV